MIYAFDVKMKHKYILFCKSKCYKDFFYLLFMIVIMLYVLTKLYWYVKDLFTLSGSVCFSLS